MERISRLGQAGAIAAGEDGPLEFLGDGRAGRDRRFGRSLRLLWSQSDQIGFRAGCRMVSLRRALACAAAVASALSLYVGRQALAVGAESGWLRARATAEAIKSECFRFAGGVGDYAPDKASDGDAATCVHRAPQGDRGPRGRRFVDARGRSRGAGWRRQAPVATNDRQMVPHEPHRWADRVL